MYILKIYRHLEINLNKVKSCEIIKFAFEKSTRRAQFNNNYNVAM